MKSCYIIIISPVRIAIADLVVYAPEGEILGQLITRINVPIGYRGLGYGSRLLSTICNDADKDKVILWVHPVSSDTEWTKQKLIRWYERYGFVYNEWGYKRILKGVE
jgi:hypothetical protein